MHERLDDLATHIPRQACELHGAAVGQAREVLEAAARTQLRQGGLGIVAGPCSSEHPFTPVHRTERVAQADVVTPRLELADRGIPTGLQPACLAVIVSRAWLQRDTGQPPVDRVADVRVEQRGADARLAAAADGRAAVADEAVRVDLAREDAPALGAPRDPGEQAVLIAPRVVASAAHSVRAVPHPPVDYRWPSVLDSKSPGADEHAERRLAADDAVHGARRPPILPTRRQDAVATEVIGDGTPPRAAGAGAEDPADDRRSGLIDDGQPITRLRVAERWFAGEPAGARGALLRLAERDVRLVEVPLPHDEQQPEHRASHRRRRVDGLGHADDAGALLVELHDRRQATEQRPGEPVEARDDDAAGAAGVDALERGVHAGPVHRAAAAVEVLVPHGDAHAVGLRPRGDRVSLLRRRLEALAGATGDLRDADVAVEDLLAPAHTCIVQSAATSRHHDDLDDMPSVHHLRVAPAPRCGDGALTRQNPSKAIANARSAIAFMALAAQARSAACTVAGMTTPDDVQPSLFDGDAGVTQERPCPDDGLGGAHASAADATPPARAVRVCKRTPWQERFWKYLEPGDPDECWEWNGSRDHHGYGRLQRDGRNGGHIKAHRASYELHNGQIPDGAVICHRCDNPPCCNPAHLFAGTMRDNARDMASKGRASAQRGHSNGREILSDEQVRELRERAAAGERLIDLARAYGVSDSNVGEIVHGNRRLPAGGPIRRKDTDVAA